MALTGDARLVFCIFVIACCCFTATLAETPVDCCLSVKNQTIAKHRVADYRLQLSSHGCRLDAMILVTRRGLKLCVPPYEEWVRKVSTHVDWLKNHCKNVGPKEKRCFGVKLQ